MKKRVLATIGVIGGIAAVVGTVFGVKKTKRNYIWIGQRVLTKKSLRLFSFILFTERRTHVRKLDVIKYHYQNH